MDSYITAPMVHATAVKNPKMLGSPFIAYGGKRVDEIRNLRQQTTKRQPSWLLPPMTTGWGRGAAWLPALESQPCT